MELGSREEGWMRKNGHLSLVSVEIVRGMCPNWLVLAYVWHCCGIDVERQRADDNPCCLPPFHSKEAHSLEGSVTVAER